MKVKAFYEDGTGLRNATVRSVLVGVAVMFFLVVGVAYVIGVQDVGADKHFGADSFYLGTKGDEVDPKELYNKLYKNTVLDAQVCATIMEKADKPMQTSTNMTWIVNGKQPSVDMNQSTITPYTAGDKIVSPAKLTFVNSNTTINSDGTMSIIANVGTGYRIEFKNIESWWCHIGKEDKTKHTTVIGSKGLFSVCGAGYIIGEAKAETEVSLYKVDANGNQTAIMFSELFGNAVSEGESAE